jgi:hypothetical protein
MSPRDLKSKKYSTETEPSPWTEPFQRAQDSTSAQPKNADQSANPETTADQTQQSGPQAHPAHMDDHTRDALSTIFNGN